MTPLSDGTPVPDLLAFGPELTTARAPAGKARRYLTAADYHALYKSGAVTPLDVASALLPYTRREGEDNAAYRAAWVPSYGRGEPLALAAARASTERWARGEPLGVMDGVPVSVKDDTDVEGYVSHRGMAYYQGQPFFDLPKKTAWPVQGLVDAGAVVIGKNAMHELGSGELPLIVLSVEADCWCRHKRLQCEYPSPTLDPAAMTSLSPPLLSANAF